jgi:hypothetical protein
MRLTGFLKIGFLNHFNPGAVAELEIMFDFGIRELNIGYT